MNYHQAKRERNKTQRERELAISLAEGAGDPNVVTAVMEGKIRAHFNRKKQAAASNGTGNPHMQVSGKNADMTFRETLNHFWWPKTNFADSQFYDRPLKNTPASLNNPSLTTNFNLSDFGLPKGRARCVFMCVCVCVFAAPRCVSASHARDDETASTAYHSPQPYRIILLHCYSTALVACRFRTRNRYTLADSTARRGSEQFRTLDGEFHGLYGKGKRCMPDRT